MLKNIENTPWFRKWNTVFFTVFLIVFLIPCVHFELSGAMTGPARIFLGGMLLLLIYGWLRSIVLLKGVLNAKSSKQKEHEIFTTASYLKNAKSAQTSKK